MSVMLHRPDGDGVIVITQPAHAWVSGQIARAWGNERFGSFEPREEVLLAAEQHDIGWLAWERCPTVDSTTGLPRAFLDLPTKEHLAIWSAAPDAASVQNEYAALLTSLHGTGLYERYSTPQDAASQALVQRYLNDQREWQARAMERLAAVPHYAPVLRPDVIERNRRLIAAWDWLSLMACMGGRETSTLDNVPTASGAQRLTVIHDGDALTLTPWPFRHERLTLIATGRRLAMRPEDDADSMRRRLRDAPLVRLELLLRASAS